VNNNRKEGYYRITKEMVENFEKSIDKLRKNNTSNMAFVIQDDDEEETEIEDGDREIIEMMFPDKEDFTQCSISKY
jgi:hypothetical protein